MTPRHRLAGPTLRSEANSAATAPRTRPATSDTARGVPALLVGVRYSDRSDPPSSAWGLSPGTGFGIGIGPRLGRRIGSSKGRTDGGGDSPMEFSRYPREHRTGVVVATGPDPRRLT